MPPSKHFFLDAQRIEPLGEHDEHAKVALSSRETHWRRSPKYCCEAEG
jgi:hypothetical protein